MSFRNDEKQRYRSILSRLFTPNGAQMLGTYMGKQRDFCLPDSCSRENLHQSVCTLAIDYFHNRRIAWHDGLDDAAGNKKALPSNHVCCSQSACVNSLAPMMLDPDLLAQVFRLFLPELREVLPFDDDNPLPSNQKPYLAFEWIGKPGSNYLGEVGNRQRRANATSADFAFRFRRYDGRIQLVLGEWKYTEEYLGRRLPLPGQVNRTQLRVYKRAFDRWCSCEPSLPPYESFFVEPFYQLMRLTLLAQEMEEAGKAGDGEMGATVVSVVHIAPAANRDFVEGFTSPVFRSLGREVTSAWAQIAPPHRFQPIRTESLLTAIEEVAMHKYPMWADWLLTRYGWWR